MGQTKPKHIAFNLQITPRLTNRMSKSFSSVLENAPRFKTNFGTFRKVILNAEPVIDGETGNILFRITLPSGMQEKILRNGINMNLEELYSQLDPQIRAYTKARFPRKSEISYQIQIK